MARKPINILQLNGRSDIGGGPKVMFNIVENINKESFNFYVAAPNEDPYYSLLKNIPEVMVFPLNLR